MPYQFLIAIGVIQSLLWLLHFWFYRTMVKFLHITNPSHLKILTWGLGLLSVAFVLGSVVSFKYYNVFTRVLYTLGAGWMAFVYFLIFASLLLWIVFGVGKIVGMDIPMRHIAAVIYSVALVLVVGSLVNAAFPAVKKIQVSLPNLPEQWKGRRVVFVSDTHLGQVRGAGFARQVVNKINAQNPEAVFIGGDLYDGVMVDEDAVVAPFKDIYAPLGTYFVTGNHEEFSDPGKFLAAIRAAGIKVLKDQKTDLHGITLYGLDYMSARGKGSTARLLAGLGVDDSRPSILLKHVPLNVDEAVAAGMDLQFYGHTHKGQAWPGQLITKKVHHGYDYGLFATAASKVYVSSGAGTWGPPFRFGTRPEIVVVTFN